MTRAQMAVFLVRAFALQAPPVAGNLAIAVNYGSQVPGQAIAIDPEGDIVAFEVVSLPAKGDLTFSADGSFTYTPTIFQVDTDSFTFRASDGQLSSNVATVNIDITRSAEISAKYDLRTLKNNHWASTVNANPGQSIIDQMVVIDLDNDGDEDLLVAQSMNPRGDPSLYQVLEMVIFRDNGGTFTRSRPVSSSISAMPQ